MGRVTLNGNVYTGRQIVVNNGKILVDGLDVTPDHKIINISVVGDIDKVSVDVCEKVDIEGAVGSVKTMSGDVNCQAVSGSISTMSGDVDCDTVGGSISTMSGDVKHRK